MIEEAKDSFQGQCQVLVLFLLDSCPPPSCLEAPEEQMAWHHPDSQCQPVSSVCHPIQDQLLALNKHRKWHTKIRHEQFEGTLELQYENPPRYASIRKQVRTAGLPLQGQRPLKCDRKNKHICFAQLVWNAFIYFISALGELRMFRAFSVIIFFQENAKRKAAGW